MGIFSRFPYTDFHRLNADWILEKVKEAAEAVAESLGLVQQSAADAAAAAAAAEDVATGSVRYDRVQDLTALQQGQARDNIQAAPANMFGAVRYDEVQLLENPQKARARSNIGAAAVADVPTTAVLYSSQSLTDEQKTQARTNIGSAAAADVPTTAVLYSSQSLTTVQQGQARDNIQAAPANMFGAVRYDEVQLLENPQKARARSNIGALQADDPSVENLYLTINDQDIQIYSDDPATGPVLYLEASNQSTSGLDVRISGVAAPTSGNDAANKDYADSIRGPLLSNISGTDVILQPDAVNAKQNTLYVCTASELNSLEINPVAAPAANREFTVRFTSGATPTELDTPLTILGLDDLVPAANTIYEINVLGNLAVWHSWEVPA